MTTEVAVSIAVISLMFIIIFKDLLFGSRVSKPTKSEKSRAKKVTKKRDDVVGYEDVEFNSDIQEIISVPLSQDEVDVLLERMGNVDGKSKSPNNNSDKPKLFNKSKFLILYGFNIIALATVSHPYSAGYVTKALGKLSEIGGAILQIIFSLVSLGISIVYSLIDSLALSLLEKYEVFAEQYLTNKFFETGALIGLIIVIVFVNSIFINKMINGKGISAKLGILINFSIMILTVVLLVVNILELYDKTSIVGLN